MCALFDPLQSIKSDQSQEFLLYEKRSDLDNTNVCICIFSTHLFLCNTSLTSYNLAPSRVAQQSPFSIDFACIVSLCLFVWFS